MEADFNKEVFGTVGVLSRARGKFGVNVGKICVGGNFLCVSGPWAA